MNHKFIILVFASVLLGSVPLIAVVTHRQIGSNGAPSFAAAVPMASALILYDVEGSRVAYCDREPKKSLLQGCHVQAGFTLDDVMNAWLRAYEDR